MALIAQPCFNLKRALFWMESERSFDKDNTEKKKLYMLFCYLGSKVNVSFSLHSLEYQLKTNFTT